MESMGLPLKENQKASTQFHVYAGGKNLVERLMKLSRPLRLLVFLPLLLLFQSQAWARGVSVDDTAAGETVITMQVELCADPLDDPNTEEKEGPSKQEVQDFIDSHKERISQIWNACARKFRIKRGAVAKRLRFVFEFTVLDNCDAEKDPAKKRYRVRLGSPPADEGKNADSETLWMDNTSRTIAHELGHGMGLDDEYDYEGGTRENLMGRGSSTKLEPYHLMTILFLNADNPGDAEARRRILMKTLLRMPDQVLAKRIAADNGITNAEYDAYKDQFAANSSQIQPGRPAD